MAPPRPPQTSAADELSQLLVASLTVAAALSPDQQPEEISDRIMVAGTPEDWVSWLRDTCLPAGLSHALVSFADPFTLKAWAGIEVEGLPELGEQVRLFGEQVLPDLRAL
jgi:hypothetical protein